MPKLSFQDVNRRRVAAGQPPLSAKDYDLYSDTFSPDEPTSTSAAPAPTAAGPFGPMPGADALDPLKEFMFGLGDSTRKGLAGLGSSFPSGGYHAPEAESGTEKPRDLPTPQTPPSGGSFRSAQDIGMGGGNTGSAVEFLQPPAPPASVAEQIEKYRDQAYGLMGGAQQLPGDDYAATMQKMLEDNKPSKMDLLGALGFGLAAAPTSDPWQALGIAGQSAMALKVGGYDRYQKAMLDLAEHKQNRSDKQADMDQSAKESEIKLALSLLDADQQAATMQTLPEKDRHDFMSQVDKAKLNLYTMTIDETDPDTGLTHKRPMNQAEIEERIKMIDAQANRRLSGIASGDFATGDTYAVADE